MWSETVRVECEIEILRFMPSVDWDELVFCMREAQNKRRRDRWMSLSPMERREVTKKKTEKYRDKKNARERQRRSELKLNQPELYAKRCKEASVKAKAKYHKVKSECPEKYEKVKEKALERSRARYLLLKEDPVAYEELLRKQRERRRKSTKIRVCEGVNYAPDVQEP